MLRALLKLVEEVAEEVAEPVEEVVAGIKRKKKKCGKGKGIVEKVVCFVNNVVKHLNKALAKI